MNSGNGFPKPHHPLIQRYVDAVAAKPSSKSTYPLHCVLRLPTRMKRRLSAPMYSASLNTSLLLLTSARVKLGSKGPERRTGALRCGENPAYLYRFWESRRADSNR